MTTQILEDNERNEMHSSPIEVAMDPISHERTIEFGQETGVTIASNELDVHELASELEVQEELIEPVVTDEPTNVVDVAIKSDAQEALVESAITEEAEFSDVAVELGTQKLAEEENSSIIDEVLDASEEIVSPLMDVAVDIIDDVLDTGTTILWFDDSENITISDEVENSGAILDLNVQEASSEEAVIMSDILVDTNNISGLDIQCEDAVALSSDTSFVDYIWGFFHNPFASSSMDDTNSTDVVL